jgi:hypothetical protein
MIRKLSIFAVALIVSLSLVMPLKLNAAYLTTGSVTMADSRISQSTNYTIQFSNVSLSPIKCIKAQFSDAATGGSKPTGMTITSTTFAGTSTYVPTPASWTINNNNTSGVSSITYATGETPANASSRTVVLNTITNGSTANTSYFLQFSTYNNVDCTTSPVDNAVIMFVFTDGQVVTATVDPTLTFSVAGVASGQTVNGATTNVTTTTTTVPFGTVTSGSNKIAAHDLAVGTNAGGGYTVTIRYTGVLLSGSNDINDLSGATNAAPIAFTAAGTESFGYTTNDATLGTGTPARFTSGGPKWAAFTTSPLEIAYSAAAASETTRVGYQVGVASTTPAGTYTTTVVYVATPTY